MNGGYTKDDAMFQNIDKTGGGIKVGTVLEQENGQKYKLIQGIDINWNDAKLAYIYAVTNSYVSDTSDLMHLIDDISHGNAIAWEEYVDEDEDNSSDSGNETPGTEDPTDPNEPLNPENPTEPSGE